MQHLDPDRLVLLVFSSEPGETAEAEHLEICARCRLEMRALRDVADIGSQTAGLRDLPAPPTYLWPAIEAEIAA